MITIKIEAWPDYRERVSSAEFRGWAYRGQGDSNWPVFSSLSRYLRDFKVHPGAWSYQEERVLRIFRRKAHLYLSHVPHEDDSFQWLALMQHHGTPTRLIDFTWSPFVAAFFALERARQKAAVWAIFPPKIDHAEVLALRGGETINPRKLSLRKRCNYETYFLPGNRSFVVMGEPEIMNRRLIAQTGTFAVPGVLDKPLDQILAKYPESDKLIVKFEFVTEKVRDEAMRYLYDSNINNATLFPDLDGMAHSLAYELEFHWGYNPKSLERVPGFDDPPFDLPSPSKE